MNQYIITEKELESAEIGLFVMSEAKEIYSRPYSKQSEMDKVLDDLLNLFRWTNKESTTRPWNIEEIEKVISVYRQCKDGE